MPTLLQPGDNSFQATDELLPAVVRALIVSFLIGSEARLLHAHERSAACRDQRPNDDALQPQSVPAIGELLVWFDDQDFAIDYAVPNWVWVWSGNSPKPRNSRKIRRLQ
jgi:hypothetical protein